MNIALDEGKLHICFRINDDQSVELVDFATFASSSDMPVQSACDKGVFRTPFKPKQFLAAHVTGETTSGIHAGKHDVGSVSAQWRYHDHKIEENVYGKLLSLSVRSNNGLHAMYYMQTYRDLTIVRCWSTIINGSGNDLGIEYVSSFFYSGIGKNRTSSNYDKVEIYIPRNGWYNEAQWHNTDAISLGLSHLPYDGFNLPDKGSSRFHYGSNDSWSSGEYLPMGLVRDPDSSEVFFFQIEHSGAWEAEYGMGDDKNLYICLLGPNDDSSWWKNLKPGQSFTTVPAAFGVVEGSISGAISQLTQYRRLIRRYNPDNEKLNVVFNDFMNCLFGDPTEEKEKEIIEYASRLGCEYYCLDAGWYDDGRWWDKVGEWQESNKRFPGGLRSLSDYAKSKGLKMGLWIEIEVMGTSCELAKRLPDDWFICTHGKRRVERERFLLDFRNPSVREYCTSVVDRLIRDYGCEYFKFDYNCTTGLGSDLNSDSLGDAMLEHYRALYEWIQSIYSKYPDLIIENCGSGGQRMDYGMLSLHSLQSTSDQTDYISNAYIAANIASAVTPEQAGMWVYPYEDDREHVIFNMVNGILLRPYISGRVWKLSEENFDVLREGISVYKTIRQEIRTMTPFFPFGFGHVNDKQLAYGVKSKNKAYLSGFAIDDDYLRVPLKELNGRIVNVKVIYPKRSDCRYWVDSEELHVKMPVRKTARLFELEIEEKG